MGKKLLILFYDPQMTESASNASSFNSSDIFVPLKKYPVRILSMLITDSFTTRSEKSLGGSWENRFKGHVAFELQLDGILDTI